MARLAAIAILLMLSVAAVRSETVKVAVAFKAAGLSNEASAALRDGFDLALRQAGPDINGHSISLTVFSGGEGTEAAQLDAFVKQSAPRVLVSALPRADALPQLKSYSDAGIVVLRPGMGGSDLAGKRCLANVFVTAAQANQPFDAIGQYIDNQPQRRTILVGEEERAEGTDVLRKSVKGAFFREVTFKESDSDLSPFIERILQDQPQQLVLNASISASVRFLAALRAAKGGADVAVLSVAASEEANLARFGEQAAGLLTAGVWATWLDGKTNSDFVAAFEQAYGYLPSSSAVYGYDAAQLIVTALGKVQSPVTGTALREAMHNAQILSPRGGFALSNNNFPIQDFYIKRVELGPNGTMRTVPVTKVFSQYGDDFAAECPLR